MLSISLPSASLLFNCVVVTKNRDMDARSVQGGACGLIPVALMHAVREHVCRAGWSCSVSKMFKMAVPLYSVKGTKRMCTAVLVNPSGKDGLMEIESCPQI